MATFPPQQYGKVRQSYNRGPLPAINHTLPTCRGRVVPPPPGEYRKFSVEGQSYSLGPSSVTRREKDVYGRTSGVFLCHVRGPLLQELGGDRSAGAGSLLLKPHSSSQTATRTTNLTEHQVASTWATSG